MIGMFRDSREMPAAFWKVYGILLLFSFALAFIATQDNVPFVVIGCLITGWGVFGGAMTVYRMGMVRAYRDAQRWAEEARDEFREGTSQVELIERRLNYLGNHFEGPS